MSNGLRMGKQLAFAGVACVENQACRFKDFNDLTVYVVNTDGTGLEQVVGKEDFGADYPVWSPQGNALLYQRTVKGVLGNFDETQIFRLIFGRDKPKQLTAVSRKSLCGLVLIRRMRYLFHRSHSCSPHSGEKSKRNKLSHLTFCKKMCQGGIRQNETRFCLYNVRGYLAGK